MKNKSIFRILGALSSSLIILAVFMPFTNVSTTNIWDINSSSDMMYLPILIIVFGGIGLIFFALNVKTEFAYASSGAITFYSLINFFQAMYNENLDALGIGFYFLAVGGVLTGFMAFLSNLKSKSKAEEITKSNEPVTNNQMNIPVINTQTIDNVSQSFTAEQPQQITVQPQIGQIQPNQTFDAPINAPINSVNMMPQNINEPISDIVGQSSVQTNSIDVQPASNLPIDYAQPIPNNNLQFSAYPLPNVGVPANSTPINNQEISNPNPVVSEFMPQQGQSSFDSTGQTSSQNMQGLDIFGNFN